MQFTKKSLMTERSIILNFSKEYCQTSKTLLSSKTFKKLLVKYLSRRKGNKRSVFNFLAEAFSSTEVEFIAKELEVFFKVITVLSLEEVSQIKKEFQILVAEKIQTIKLIESFYNYWRKIQRFSIISPDSSMTSLESINFLKANDEFKNLVLKTYRQIEEKLMGSDHLVYRQLKAGINAGLVLKHVDWKLPFEYQGLEKIPFIEKVTLEPPFIFYSKTNKRKGIFNEVDALNIECLDFSKNEWMAFAIKVGKQVALFYFHVNFISMAVSIINLFELLDVTDIEGIKPDLVYVFGYDDKAEEKNSNYFIDKKNNIYYGYSNGHDDIDYFGYIKKLLLTLHNVRLINEGIIPLHGAMVNLVMKNGETKNIVIIGDSGAGKSESLEAFRSLAKDYIRKMTIIFDDMGYFKIENNKIMGYGTEIGAFIRIDDLEKGYPYEQIDRSIFMNPDKDVNARMVIPISTYESISQGHEVDMILQANNFEEKEALEKFDTLEKAIKIFTKGKRMAKGTTSEKGVIDSYFSNPFGPVQEQRKTNKLIKQYFAKAFELDLYVGQIRTRLGIKGQEMSGPKSAGEELFKQIMSKKI